LVGDARFDIPAGLSAYQSRLVARFPAERAGIEAYFAAVLSLNRELRRLGTLGSWRDLAAPTVARWGWRTARPFIDHFTRDPLLQAILASQSGDHGLPPNQVSAAVHAGVAHHYFDGGHYPVGGGGAIPRAFVRALRRAGSDILLQQRVARILIDQGRAAGVELADGTRLTADIVVSNADPLLVLTGMLPADQLNWRWRRRLRRGRYSVSALSLFLAVDRDLRGEGLDSGNYWMYDHADLDALYGLGLTDHVVRTGKVPMTFLTATTLKDPTKLHSGHHTLEAFAFTSYAPFARWADRPEGARGAEYEALKTRLTEAMVQRLERLLPGLREDIVFSNLGTPLTNAHYVAAPEGSLYGLAKTPAQVGPGAYPVAGPLAGLFFCGASTLSHGVAGATQSGLRAAAAALGCRIRDLLVADGPPLQAYPAENPAAWPGALQAKIRSRHDGLSLPTA
jgi:phytoene dehydrogenase-like protein